MPSRIIRESALTSASLDQLSPAAERLFWRLLLIADDYGRFEADPAVLAARCFPRRRIAARVGAQWLQELVDVGTVELYCVGDKLYGWFPSWFTHQRRRESKPKYPAPEDGSRTPDLLAFVLSTPVRRDPPQVAATRRRSRSGSRRDGAGGMEPQDAGMGDEVQEKGESPLLPSVASGGVDSSPQALADLWNKIIPKPQVQELRGVRLKHTEARLREHPDLTWWRQVIERILATPFLRGAGSRRWVASFDWMIANDLNVIKVLEGKYDAAASPQDRKAEYLRSLQVLHEVPR